MKAIVLLSGGMDSAVTLYKAKSEGYACRCLIFDYGQVHKREIFSAMALAEDAGCKWELLKIKLPAEGSALLGVGKIPDYKDSRELPGVIPPTYVPARNTIFLSMGISWAESIGAKAIFIGAHLRDAPAYPDCGPAYFYAFKKFISEATRDKNIEVYTPVLEMTKKEIVEKGQELRVPFALTWSCYKGGEFPCARCAACIAREKGFQEAGRKDPSTAKLCLPSKSPTAEIEEIFISVQGEGLFLGQRHLFVRFSGCNLACSYCDERNTENIPRRLSVEELIAKINALKALPLKISGKSLRSMDKQEKGSAPRPCCGAGPVAYIAVTGGEPLLQADYLRVLFPELKKRGERIYLETNGTLPDELKEVIAWIDVIAMDIKLPSASGEELGRKHEQFLKIANSRIVLVKVVVERVSGEEEFKKAVGIIQKVNYRIPLVLQPASPLPEDKRGDLYAKLERFQTLALARLEDVRVIPQVHKILGLK